MSDVVEVPSPAIDAVDLVKTFDRGQVAALDRLSLRVEVGEYVAVTGPSGCGKSTLLHLIAALDHPDSGELRVAGHDLAQLEHPNHFRREAIGLVFQMHNLLPHLDVLANIGIAMLGSARGRHEQRDRARELVTAVGLEGLGGRRPPELSGGERQRVAIARALANRPAILLADEPTGSLDAAAKELVLDLLDRTRQEDGTTVVTVTHDPDVTDAADRVVRLGVPRTVDGSSVDTR